MNRQIEKGVILAAGRGTRLSLLTKNRPKPLLPIADTNFILHSVQNLQKAGIQDIIVVTSPLIAKQIQYPDIQVHVQEQPLGTANALLAVEDLQEPFFMTYCDNITGESLSQYVSTTETTILVKSVADPTQHGIVQVNRELGRVTSIVERPTRSDSNLGFAGMGIFTPEIFSYIKNLRPQGREYYLTDALNLMARDIPVKYRICQRWRHNVNRYEDYIKAHILLTTETCSFANQTINTSEIKGPSSCKGTLGKNCIIGPLTTIEEDVIIGDNTTIEYSIILKGSKIGSNCIVKNSIINGVVKDNFNSKTNSLTIIGDDGIEVIQRSRV